MVDAVCEYRSHGLRTMWFSGKVSFAEGVWSALAGHNIAGTTAKHVTPDHTIGSSNLPGTIVAVRRYTGPVHGGRMDV